MLRLFQNFLERRNIQSSFMDEDKTMLQFSVNDINFVFMYKVKEDPTYIRLLIPNAGIVDEQDDDTIRKLYNLTNSYKVGKAYILDNQVWFSADAFIYNRDNNDMLFDRLLGVLSDMLYKYRQNINEESHG